jgi:L-threonate 2-dehydrogenase
MMNTVGVIGAGNMGAGMAQSALRAGFKTLVCDIDPERQRQAKEYGAIVATNARELAEQAQWIMIVVLNAEQIQTVLDQIDDAVRPDQVVFICSTIAPQDTIRFAEIIRKRGAQLIDAPISGGPAKALAGTMSMMLAAPAIPLATVRSLIDAVSGTQFVISEQVGDAAKAKLVNNLLAGIHLAAAGEAMALASDLGLNAQVMFDLVQASSGQSWMFGDRVARSLKNDYAPRAQAHVLTKDVTLANQVAASIGRPLPLGAQALATLQSTCTAGFRDEDDAAVLKYTANSKNFRHEKLPLAELQKVR